MTTAPQAAPPAGAAPEAAATPPEPSKAPVDASAAPGGADAAAAEASAAAAAVTGAEVAPKPARMTFAEARAKAARWAALQPITPLWLVVFGGALLGLRLLAGPRMDLVVMVMGYVGLALCALALVVVVPAAVVIWRAIRGRGRSDTAVLEAGVPVVTGMDLPNLAWLPLLDVDWRWLKPRGALVEQRRQGWRRVEAITFTRRGRVEQVIRQFSVADVLGLARSRWEHHTHQRLTILPNVGRLRQVPVLQAFQSGDQIPHPSGKPEGDRHEMRRYTHGYSARHIVWKVYSRSRRLMVRLPERAIARSSDTAAYLIAGDGDEPSAAAARVAVESDVLGQSWRFGADGSAGGCSSRADALDRIALSGVHTDAQGAGLKAFIEQAQQDGYNRCLTFAPNRPGPWLDQVTAAEAEHKGTLQVIVGIDSFRRTIPVPWYKRLLGELPQVEEVGFSDELAELTDTLTRAGIPTLVLDRQAGRPVPLSVIRSRTTSSQNA